MQDSGAWRDINRCKALVTEPRGSADEFNRAIRRFRSLVDSGKGAVFMAVCRGKVCTAWDPVSMRAGCGTPADAQVPSQRAQQPCPDLSD